jgi:hypothetical protein
LTSLRSLSQRVRTATERSSDTGFGRGHAGVTRGEVRYSRNPFSGAGGGTVRTPPDDDPLRSLR